MANVLAAMAGGVATLLGIRALEPPEWAIAAVALGLGPALGVVLSLGSVNYQARSIARQDDVIVQRTLAAFFFVRRLIVSFPLMVAGTIVAFLWDDGALIGVIVSLGAVRFVRGGASVLLNGQRRFGELALLVGMEKVAYFLSVAVMFYLDRIAVLTLPWLYTASLAIYIAVSLLRERLPLASVFCEAMRTPFGIWRGSGAFGIASLAGPVQQLDVLIVGAFAGPVQAGYFAAGSRLTSGLNVAGSALSSVVLSMFARGEAISMRRGRKQKWILVIATFLLLSVWSVLVFFAPEWVPVILGNQYSGASMVISVYLIGVLLQTVNIPVSALLQAWSDERFVMWLSVAQSAFLLTGLALMSHIFGSTGAAFAYLTVMTCSLCVYVLRVFTINRRIRSLSVG